jgi:hypothetical protein
MKKSIKLGQFLFVFATLLGINACSNDIDLTEGWKDVTIVNGLLNQQDTVHYLSVQKGFLDPTRNVFEVAKIADSLYYPEDKIKVQLFDAIRNTTVGTFKRVSVADLGITPASGIFANNPKYVYKLSGVTLDSSRSYHVIVDKSALKLSESKTVNPVSLISMKSGVPSSALFDFYQNTPTDFSFTTSIKTVNTTAAIASVSLNINYKENGQLKTLRWPINTNLDSAANITNTLSQFNIVIDKPYFFTFLEQKLGNSAPNSRCIQSLELVVDLGGSEISKYIKRENTDLGLSSGFVAKPYYTNLTNGRGVVSSKYTYKVKLPLSGKSYTVFTDKYPNLGFLPYTCL